MARAARSLVHEAAATAGFVLNLPRLLRRAPTTEQARALVRRRLAARESSFLGLMQRAIYQGRLQPWAWLVATSGCQYGDLVRLVEQEGLEGALGRLWQAGLYLTVAELKGRQPIVRGSASLLATASLPLNPLLRAHFHIPTSGSGGPRVAIPFDLRTIGDRAINRHLALAARGGLGWRHAYWGVPGSQALLNVLEFAAAGAPKVRWFVQVDPRAPSLSPLYRWSARGLRLGGLLAGQLLPTQQYVAVDAPLPIARWMAGELRAGRVPHLNGFASPAARVCQAALEAGLDLSGAQFTVGAEPVTEGRLALFQRVGATAVPGYGTSETSRIAYGCLAPAASDEVHLSSDLHALIQAGPEKAGVGLPPNGLLITSLSPTAPLVLLNASLGDQAVLAERACGCPLEQLGWQTHLHTIRSFEKLSAGGMTFLDTDVIRVLDQVLPSRFGGGPTDYQLLEEEADDGRPRLVLLAHPRLGPLDERALIETFLSALGHGSGPERVMALQWRTSSLLTVERRAPRMTATGKVLHLYRGSRPSGAG